MKRLCLLPTFMAIWIISIAQNVGIGTTTPHASAQLEVSGTDRGFLPPRLTTAQRNNIINPANGLIIYNTTTALLEIFGSAGWQTIATPAPAIKNLYGGSNTEYIKEVLPAADGGCIIAGYTTSNNSGTFSGLINYGGQDAWVIKLDPNGKIVWQRLMGGTGTFDTFQDIIADGSGGYLIIGGTTSSNSGTLTGITGNGGQDAWLVKLDASGNMIWQKLFGGAGNDYFFSIIESGDGGFIIAGGTYSSSSGTLGSITNNGAIDGWVIKVDTNGNTIWQKLFGGDIADVFYTIAATTDGGFMLAGSSNSTSGTGTLAGTSNNGGQDGWIIKINSAGIPQWQKLYGGNGTDILNKIKPSTSGEYYCCGTSTSSNSGTLAGNINNGVQDGWVMKISGDGSPIWQHLLGGTDTETFTDIAVKPDNSIIITGRSASALTGTLAPVAGFGSDDAWLIVISSNGTTITQKLLGGINADSFESIKVLDYNRILIAGVSASANNGSLNGIAGFGGTDLWVIIDGVFGN
ncbi:MAG: hypothetical protein ABIX01_17820 [Chitinophagaceae bacterium]